MQQLITVLASVLHGVLAGIVTVHVLLRHENLRSSIGWIGLAWLSPFAGSAIYAMFGINRVQRRAIKLKISKHQRQTRQQTEGEALGDNCPPGIRALARTVDAVTSLPLATGNKAELFIDGSQTYPAMISAIDGAEKSVALASYIFSDDEGGAPIVDALIRARQRGVEVRVLVDGIGSGYLFTPVIKRLRKGGVTAEKFLHEILPWRMPFTNLRNHKKLLVVDGRIGFAGGINIDAENLAIAEEPNVRDVHARLTGPIVEHLMLTFSSDWEFSTSETLLGEIWWPQLEPEGEMAMRGIASGPDEMRRRIETVFLAAVENASERVRIVTPYFLPEERVLDVLARAALRGVKIEIVVPRKSNLWYFNWALKAHLERIPLDQIEFRLAREAFDHSKLMTVDGWWVSFGSANWDARSMRLNFEFVVEGYGVAMAREFDSIIDSKLKGSVRLTAAELKARPLLAKLRDAAVRLLLPYL